MLKDGRRVKNEIVSIEEAYRAINLYVQDLIDIIPRKFENDVVVIVQVPQDASNECSIHNVKISDKEYLDITRKVEEIYNEHLREGVAERKTIEYLEDVFKRRVKRVITVTDSYDYIDVYIL